MDASCHQIIPLLNLLKQRLQDEITSIVNETEKVQCINKIDTIFDEYSYIINGFLCKNKISIQNHSTNRQSEKNQAVSVFAETNTSNSNIITSSDTNNKTNAIHEAKEQKEPSLPSDNESKESTNNSTNYKADKNQAISVFVERNPSNSNNISSSNATNKTNAKREATEQKETSLPSDNQRKEPKNHSTNHQSDKNQSTLVLAEANTTNSTNISPSNTNNKTNTQNKLEASTENSLPSDHKRKEPTNDPSPSNYPQIYENTWNQILNLNYNHLQTISQWIRCSDCYKWRITEVAIESIKQWTPSPHWNCKGCHLPITKPSKLTHSSLQLLALNAQRVLSQLKQQGIQNYQQNLRELQKVMQYFSNEIYQETKAPTSPPPRPPLPNETPSNTDDTRTESESPDSNDKYKKQMMQQNSIIISSDDDDEEVKVTKKDMFECTECGRTFEKKKGLARHKAVHNKTGKKRKNISNSTASDNKNMPPRKKGKMLSSENQNDNQEESRISKKNKKDGPGKGNKFCENPECRIIIHSRCNKCRHCKYVQSCNKRKQVLVDKININQESEGDKVYGQNQVEEAKSIESVSSDKENMNVNQVKKEEVVSKNWMITYDGDTDDSDDDESDVDMIWHHQNAYAPLICVCRKAFDTNQGKIQCDKCSEWYHYECIGLSVDKARLLDEYKCDKCKKAEDSVNSSLISNVPNKRRSLFNRRL